MSYFTRTAYFTDHLVHAAVIAVGEQACRPGHSYAGIRQEYVIHFILSGRGTYRLDGIHYSLSAGQGFLIPPATVNRYAASPHEPWHYCWVHLSGAALIEAIPAERTYPVLQPAGDEDMTQTLRHFIDRNLILRNTRADALKAAGEVFKLLSRYTKKHAPTAPVDRGWYHRATSFIDRHYTSDIRVNDVVKLLFMDRSYVSREFKRLAGIPMQTYIQNKRLAKARDYLRTNELTVKEIAYSVGFHDYATFSRLFKNKTGVSPGEWRRLADPGGSSIMG